MSRVSYLLKVASDYVDRHWDEWDEDRQNSNLLHEVDDYYLMAAPEDMSHNRGLASAVHTVDDDTDILEFEGKSKPYWVQTRADERQFIDRGLRNKIVGKLREIRSKKRGK